MIKALKRIEWGVDASDVSLPNNTRPVAPAGYVVTVNYRWNDLHMRRYTFAKCAREGCPHDVLVDYDQPEKQCLEPDSYSVGGYGGDDLPIPSWWGRSFCCGEALGTMAAYPCDIVHGPVMAEVEKAGICWTVWGQRGLGMGSVLFYDVESHSHGLLEYRSPAQFKSRNSVIGDIRWGTPRSLHEKLSRTPGYDDVLDTLQVVIGTT